MQILFTILVTTFVIVLTTSSNSKNDSPIIGVFAQPSHSNSDSCGANCEYIAASYVKFIESAGGRVVPISYYSSTETIDKYINSLNGWFFPGGAAMVPSSALYLYDRIIKRNEAGEFTPLWGTCLGFEWILCAASKNTSVLDRGLDSWNLSLPLAFTKKSAQSSLFAKAPRNVLETLVRLNITFNNHLAGILVDHFYGTEELVEEYNVLSVNKDRRGATFVSAIESKKHPVYGVQWHPEKNMFEWAVTSDGQFFEAIDHSLEAVLASQYFANFFVNKCRHNHNRFESVAEQQAALIYNYPKFASGPDFVETYYFHFNDTAAATAP